MTDCATGNGQAAADALGASDVDDRWAEAVQLLDEALAANGRASSDTSMSCDLDSDAPAEVVKAQLCLQRLARLRESWEDTLPVFSAEEAHVTPNEGKQLVASADATPNRIARFEIRAELGRGGQGVVFLAWDPQLQRAVALKVPRPELLLTRDMRRRFLREGRAAAGLNHPHIVAVYEVGEEGPVCFIAQEHCRGRSLAAWLKASPRPLDPRVAAMLVRDLADAVEHAHARGILHRDLKPSNVLLAADGSVSPEALHPKLIDFGLAKALEQTDDETATGAILGTAAYMPPEQAAGRKAEIGRASDVYGLGAILYEISTGQPPFAGASPLEILRKVASEDPIRPRTIQRKIPRDLEAICLRCLEKKPGLRYGTAGDLFDDLKRFLQGEPTLARPATPVERAIKWARRRPWIAALVAVVLASVLALGTTVTVYTVQLRAALGASEDRRAEAEQSRQIVRQQLYASDIGLAQDALNMYRAGDCIDILRRQAPTGGDLDLREFCWGYLWQQTHQALRELHGHRGGVYAVDYSPDGRLLASAGEDGIVRVWEPATGKLLAELSGHESEINGLEFSPDGRQLATVSDKGELFLWSVDDTIHLKHQTSLTPSELYSVCYAPDGTRIAIGGDDSQVRLVSAADGSVQHELSKHEGPVFALAFRSGGRRLVSGGKDGRLLEWDLDGGQPPSSHEWFQKADPIRAIAISPDDMCVAISQGGLFVYRISDFDRLAQLAGPADEFSSIQFSKNGKSIIASNHDSTWRIWEWESSPRAFRVGAGHAGQVFSAGFSPDEKQVATAGADGLVRQWSATSVGTPCETTLECPEGADVTYSVGGDWLLLKRGGAHESLLLELYGWRSGAWQRVEQWRAAEMRNGDETCAISSDGRWVVRSGGGPHVLAWQVGVSHDWARIGTLDSRIGNLAFTPSGNIVVAANMDLLCAWELSPPRLLWRTAVPRSDVRTLVSTDSSVACAIGNALEVVELATGKRRVSTQLPVREFLHLAMTADGSELLAAGKDRSVNRWRMPSGRPLKPWIGHAESVLQLAVHPDGRTVASVDAKGNLQLWHRLTGRAALTLRTNRPESMAFSSDGRFLHVTEKLGRDGSQIVSYRSCPPTSSLTPDPGDRPNPIVAGGSDRNPRPFQGFLSESLDPTFDGVGIVATSILRSSTDGAHAIGIQPDGKIVVAGYAQMADDRSFALVRYLHDGSLDATFDPVDRDGKLTTNIRSNDIDDAKSLAIQADGKIVAAGYMANGDNWDFAIVRYNSDGSLDTSFDHDGIVTTAIGSGDDLASGVAIQPDGKIIAIGYCANRNNRDFTLVRYNADGNLDESFDGDGIVSTAIGSDDDVASSVAIQPDGKIIVAGCCYRGSNCDFALARYNADGGLDASLDHDGIVTTAIGLGDSFAKGLALQRNGKIVVAGSSTNGGSSDITVVRHNVDGSLDASFDGDGIVTTDIWSGDVALAVAIQSDGRIVASGSCHDGSHLVLTRYTAEGHLDTSFDRDGIVMLDTGTGNEELLGVAIQSDGKIVAGGIASNGDFVVVRLNASTPTGGVGSAPAKAFGTPR